ncbi:uncharacterized protein LOC132172072 [Corylus avellana]|uniref:uncharacterized protein LOC132172072 n=1 Tax=Corylus avellana TaxID=13451 RepID=UPI001E23787E|nr:uncharacterized protein LOC132172072 [Corylus avellana]
MDVEQVMKLFDSCWFELEILKKVPNPSDSSSSEANPDHQIQEGPSKREISRVPTLHTRSMSDQSSSKTSFKSAALSPVSVLLTAKLHTIHSGKEVTESEPEQPKPTDFEVSSKKKMTRERGGTKSLSDLEFEELKGFMDLGFVFSDEDRNDSNLASILPGLQRFGKKDGEEEEIDESAISRPYLSEAWEVFERRKAENPLMNWRIPALSSEINIKDSLRLWAHTVASTVR